MSISVSHHDGTDGEPVHLGSPVPVPTFGSLCSTIPARSRRSRRAGKPSGRPHSCIRGTHARVRGARAARSMRPMGPRHALPDQRRTRHRQEPAADGIRRRKGIRIPLYSLGSGLGGRGAPVYWPWIQILRSLLSREYARAALRDQPHLAPPIGGAGSGTGVAAPHRSGRGSSPNRRVFVSWMPFRVC